jgi:hypothetical protein
MIESFQEEWVEHDLNPITVFDSAGKILYLNNEASYLLSKVDKKHLYDLALQYAPQTYGFATQYQNLFLDKFEFYAISVVYQNEDQIGVKLYKVIQPNITPTLKQDNTQITNIYSLIELAISTNQINTNQEHKKEFDPTLPEMRLNVNNVIKLLDMIYKSFDRDTTITTSLMLKVGEYIKINAAKVPVMELRISCSEESSIVEPNPQIAALAQKSSILFEANATRYILTFGLITE